MLGAQPDADVSLGDHQPSRPSPNFDVPTSAPSSAPTSYKSASLRIPSDSNSERQSPSPAGCQPVDLAHDFPGFCSQPHAPDLPSIEENNLADSGVFPPAPLFNPMGGGTVYATPCDSQDTASSNPTFDTLTQRNTELNARFQADEEVSFNP